MHPSNQADGGTIHADLESQGLVGNGGFSEVHKVHQSEVMADLWFRYWIEETVKYYLPPASNQPISSFKGASPNKIDFREKDTASLRRLH